MSKMTPKEKAEELINRYLKALAGGMYDVRGEAKKCALICVDELISCLPSINGRPPNYQDRDKYTSEYWQEVKQKLLKDE